MCTEFNSSIKSEIASGKINLKLLKHLKQLEEFYTKCVELLDRNFQKKNISFDAGLGIHPKRETSVANTTS
jgi:hypothetical protein